ncbi:MAG: hypothetical protein J6W48_09775 [Lachnospiraceae bacterium]|nr:hypothetical protein [Lachnospiraceae bacterium]
MSVVCLLGQCIGFTDPSFSFLGKVREHSEDVSFPCCDDHSSRDDEHGYDEVVKDNERLSGSAGIPCVVWESFRTSAEEFDDLKSAEEYYDSVKEDKSKWVLLPLQKLTTTLIEVNPDDKEIIKIINTCIV